MTFRGSVRRMQYTFNNTVEDGYSPPPCSVDWPDQAFGGKYNWAIGHCTEIVSNSQTHENSIDS